MKDRFDLEHEITQCSCIVDDLEMMIDVITESDKSPWNETSPQLCDALHNKLFGIKELYQMRFERLEDTFCQAFELNQYAPQEVKDLRAGKEQRVSIYSNSGDYQTQFTLSLEDDDDNACTIKLDND
jgi:hypothetical protein